MKDTKFSLNRHEERAREAGLVEKARAAHAVQHNPERDRMQSRKPVDGAELDWGRPLDAYRSE